MTKYTSFTPQSDPRIAELEELAAELGLRLPLPIDLILFFEDHGFVVDLISGKVYRDADCTPMPIGVIVGRCLASMRSKVKVAL